MKFPFEVTNTLGLEDDELGIGASRDGLDGAGLTNILAVDGDPGVAAIGAVDGDPGVVLIGAVDGDPGVAAIGATDGDPGVVLIGVVDGDPGVAAVGAVDGDLELAAVGAVDGDLESALNGILDSLVIFRKPFPALYVREKPQVPATDALYGVYAAYISKGERKGIWPI